MGLPVPVPLAAVVVAGTAHYGRPPGHRASAYIRGSGCGAQGLANLINHSGVVVRCPAEDDDIN